MKAVLWMACLIPALLKTCSTSVNISPRVELATVSGETIYLDEALDHMPSGLSAKDSADYVQEYLLGRINDLLVYQVAIKNIPANDEIDKMVENYRHSLFIYEYQQQILNEKFKSEIAEDELKAYYSENKFRFTADQDLVKGFFIKLPLNAPNKSDLHSWMKKHDAVSLQKIESYCVKYATIYNYCMDQWAPMGDLLSILPDQPLRQESAFQKNVVSEMADNTYSYLFFVSDKVNKGEIAPFDYIRPIVYTILLNKKKTEFIRQFEKDLRDYAKKEGQLVIF